MIGRFFHTPQTKQFNIRPRFHDPDKDERDDREQRIKEELGIVDEKKKDLKKKGTKKNQKKTKKKRKG